MTIDVISKVHDEHGTIISQLLSPIMIRLILLLTALTASTTTGFTIPTSSTTSHTKLSAFNEDDTNINFQSYDPLNLSNDELYTNNNGGRTATAITTALLTASIPLVASGKSVLVLIRIVCLY